jgi:peptide deformylase
MAIKPILLFSDHEAALRKKSEPVRVVNRQIKKLIQDLKDTLVACDNGIGLAAPQINVHSRVIAVQLGGRSDGEAELGPPLILINPEIVETNSDEKDFDGCLSFPGLFADTVRPHYLKVKALDEWGKSMERVFEGFDAVVVHHEIDHLDGVLFIDRVTSVADLYRVREAENGEWVRVPVAEIS